MFLVCCNKKLDFFLSPTDVDLNKRRRPVPSDVRRVPLGEDEELERRGAQQVVGGLLPGVPSVDRQARGLQLVQAHVDVVQGEVPLRVVVPHEVPFVMEFQEYRHLFFFLIPCLLV